MFFLSSESLFRLPAHEGEARQVYYGFLVGGILSLPMIIIVYQKFVAPQVGLGIREFFLIFTALYGLVLAVSSGIAQSTSSKLRKRLDENLPKDAVVLAPIAARSNVPEVVLMGRVYWFWQIVGSYLSGVAISWFGCVFALFVI